MYQIRVVFISILVFGLFLEIGCRKNINVKKRTLKFTYQTRMLAENGSGDFEIWRVINNEVQLDPSKTAVIVMDMWNKEGGCRVAKKRAAHMIPSMNEALDAARLLGMKVIFSPSGILHPYTNTSQRKAVTDLPNYKLPDPVIFNPSEPPWSRSKYNMSGGESVPTIRMIGQHPELLIKEDDLISADSRQEIWNICQEFYITHIFYMGVHTNMCILNRPNGIVEMRRLKLKCFLVRDLTDAWTDRHDPETGKFDENLTNDVGTKMVIEHFEKFICPTITSLSILDAANRIIRVKTSE
jgi:nicotinamidase-related amidase